MIIKSIDLQNFRNYELQKIDFDSGTNILYGDNAQGKTNTSFLKRRHWGTGSSIFIRHNQEPPWKQRPGNDCI